MTQLLQQAYLERGSYEDSGVSSILLYCTTPLTPLELYGRVKTLLFRAYEMEEKDREECRKNWIENAEKAGTKYCDNCAAFPEFLNPQTPGAFLDQLWKSDWQDELVTERLWPLMESLDLRVGLRIPATSYLRMSRIEELFEGWGEAEAEDCDEEGLQEGDEDEYYEYNVEIEGATDEEV